jgi:NitT/TauT family transport system substrate-binding protein
MQRPHRQCAQAPPPARSGVIRIVCLALCLGLLAGCSEKPLRLGIHPWIGYDVLPMTRGWGWLEPGIELVDVRSGAGSLDRLESGDLHAACLTLDEVILGRERGIPLSVIAVMDTSSGADALLARRDIESLADLAGRRVALQRDSVNLLVLTAALDKVGLTPADVTLVDATPDALLPLWQREEVDAAVAYEPFARRLREAGAQVLFSSRDTPELIFDVIAVHRDAIPGRHRTLERLAGAVMRAQAHVHDNPIDSLYRLASVHDRALGVTEEELRRVVIPTTDAQRDFFRPRGSLALAAERINRLFLDSGAISEARGGEDLLDPRFLPESAP